MAFLYFVLIGAVAGWLAGQVMKSGSFGLLANILLGIIGGFFGGWLFEVLGINSENSLAGSLITSTVGAIALIFIVRILKKIVE